MHSNQSTFAVLVSASTFELLNAAGSVVATLGATTIGITPASALFMRHLDATVVDSSLSWTQGATPGFQSVQLTGPKTTAGTTTPLLRFSSIGAQSDATLQIAGPLGINIGVNSTTGFSITDQGRSSFVQSFYPGFADYGAGKDNGADVYYHRASSTFSRVGHGDYSGGGGSFVEKAYVGVNGVTAAVIGESEAIIRSGSGTTEYVQCTGGNVNLGAMVGGRVNLGTQGVGNRPTWLPVSAQMFDAPASVNVPFRSFVMNGINTPAGIVGDIYQITLSARIVCVAAGGAWIGEIQGFGGGFGVHPSRCIATGWVVGHDASIHHTWTLTQTVAGAVTWAIVGGDTAGDWVLVAPDSSFSVVHYGFR